MSIYREQRVSPPPPLSAWILSKLRITADSARYEYFIHADSGANTPVNLSDVIFILNVLFSQIYNSAFIIPRLFRAFFFGNFTSPSGSIRDFYKSVYLRNARLALSDVNQGAEERNPCCPSDFLRIKSLPEPRNTPPRETPLSLSSYASLNTANNSRRRPLS